MNTFNRIILGFAVLLTLISSYSLYYVLKVESKISALELNLKDLSDTEYNFIIREIDKSYILITLTITVLFGLIVFFINFNIRGRVSDIVTELQHKYDESVAKYDKEIMERHKLEGDLNITAYNGLRLNSMFLLDKEDDLHEVPQYYLAMSERVALAIKSYNLAKFDFDKEYYDYIKEDLNSLKDYIDEFGIFQPNHLSYSRYCDLKETIDYNTDEETSKILHDIGSKMKFSKLED
jgi:hypothetical protein